MGKRIRKIVQVLWGLLTNAYIKGFLPGGQPLYRGVLKHFCVPGMNCYSCPGAIGACPIGALQSVLTARNRKFPLYVLGYLIGIGTLVGRFICGWLCLFGLIQELLYKIPLPKLKVPEKADALGRNLKYVVLTVLVIGLPLFFRNEFGTGIPFFCKYVCPVGTLEGGVPLVFLNETLRPSLGGLFNWKLFLLILTILSSIVIYRPFCRYICPLGAFYSLFQKVSLVRLRVDTDTCISCGACKKACGMMVDPHITPNSTECIRCGECIHACPVHALSFTGPSEKKKVSVPKA